MMRITRIEFDDPDDPESSCNQDKFRMTIAPEGMVLTLPGGKYLGKEDQEMMGKLVRMAYEQGKAVGKLVGSINNRDENG